MKKQELIDDLVDMDIDTIQQMLNENDTTYLDSFIRNGFMGYANFSYKELLNEYNERTKG